MTRIVACIFLSLLLQSCVVWPDPWREEVYQAISTSEVSGEQQGTPPHDKYLGMSVIASGYSFDLHSPYQILVRFDSTDLPIELVIINDLKVTLGDRELDSLSIRNVKSKNEVLFGSETIDLDPAPCCIFWIKSEQVELAHVPDEVLTVMLEFCLMIDGIKECRGVERHFRAVVRKGLFQVTEV